MEGTINQGKRKTPLKKPLLWIIFPIYFTLNVIYHRKINEFFDLFLQWMSYEQFNRAVLLAFLTLAVAFFAALVLAALKTREKLFWLAVLIAWMLLSLLAHYFLQVSNIELIHYPQYAILAVIIYLIICNETYAVLGAALLGALDEAFQFLVLYADRTDLYMDYNDVILNLLGAILGIISYKILNSAFEKASSGHAEKGA
ncbi:MAG: hypothetical protein Kow0090_10180 [Myxococcota bacterium]